MAIRSDSYSSIDEVKAFVRHMLNGQTTFNTTTRPTAIEVEKMIDRASGVLNVAIARAGFAPSNVYVNSTAKLACDDWTAQEAAKQVELTQRGVGYDAKEGSRVAAFNMNTKTADEFIGDNKLGFIRLGIAQTYKLSDGLQYTGLTAQADRLDTDDTSLEQPMFKRSQWNNEND